MTTSRVRSWLPWLLAFALVAAQALGLMHRIVHGPQTAIGPRAHAEHLHLAGADDQAHAHARAGAHTHVHGLEALFSGHEDDSTCRLFDPLNHEAATSVPLLVLPLLLAPCHFERLHADFVARWSTLFDARGPPAFR